MMISAQLTIKALTRSCKSKLSRVELGKQKSLCQQFKGCKQFASCKIQKPTVFPVYRLLNPSLLAGCFRDLVRCVEVTGVGNGFRRTVSLDHESV